MARPVHFLAIEGATGGPLCGRAVGAEKDPHLTVLVQRITCPHCLDRLSRLLAGCRNRALLWHQGAR